MSKAAVFVTKSVMFLLLGVLLFASDLMVHMWQFHAIALWGIAMANIGGYKDGRNEV